VIFERPLFPGDTLYAESEVLEKRESDSKRDRGIVAIGTPAFNQNKERVLVLRRQYLFPNEATHDSCNFQDAGVYSRAR
jgi:acyl dehydratase